MITTPMAMQLHKLPNIAKQLLLYLLLFKAIPYSYVIRKMTPYLVFMKSLIKKTWFYVSFESLSMIENSTLYYYISA